MASTPRSPKPRRSRGRSEPPPTARRSRSSMAASLITATSSPPSRSVAGTKTRRTPAATLPPPPTHPGDRVVVSGKLKRFGRKLTLDNPDFQPEGNDDEMLHVGRIVPVYRLTAGLTATRLRIAMREALDRAGREYPEYLAAAIRDSESLAPIGTALEEAHYPASFDGRDAALRRLAFDELLALQLGMVGRRRQRGRDAARPMAIDDPADAVLRASLTASIGRKLARDVALTVAQERALDAIRIDLAQPTPMLRLLPGH